MTKPNVIVTVEPMEGRSIVYLPVAPPTAKDKPGSQVALKLPLDNQQDSDVHLIKINIVFGIAPDVDFVAPVIYDKDSVAQKDLFPFLIAKGATRRFNFSRTSKDNIKLPSPPPPGFTMELFFDGYDTPVTVSNLKLAPHANPTPKGSYRFPAKASDLTPGPYWSGASSGRESHHSGDERFGHDMGVMAWDSEKNEWSGLKPQTLGNNKTDYLCWNEPVYAMADSVVQAIENGKPDIPPKSPEEEQNKGANFVKIQHGDEEVLYLHLKKGSVEPNLSKGVHVKAGQLLGRVGNSGNTDAPHLHIDADKNGHLPPILFHDIHVVAREILPADDSPNAPWVAVDGQGLPWRGKEGNAIWPAPIPPKQVTRLGDSGTQAGAIRIIAAASVGPDQVVTAVRTQKGNLKLIVWDISSDGKTVTRLGDSGNQAGVSDQYSGQFLSSESTIR